MGTDLAAVLSKTPDRDMRWWLADKITSSDEGTRTMQDDDARRERCRRFVNRCKSLMERSRSRIEMYLHFARLYYGYAMNGIGPESYAEEADVLDAEPIADNLARVLVKSALPRVCKGKPRPMFATVNGRWDDRVRAIKTERVVAADFQRMGLHKSERWLIRVGAVFGMSGWHFYDDGSDMPRVDRVLPWQLIVDPRDAYHGEPRSLMLWRYVDRSVLMTLYPKHAKQIAEAKLDAQWLDWLDPTSDTKDKCDGLFVWFGWHLRSGEKADDGRYMVAIQGMEEPIVDKPWDDDGYPVEIFRWEEPLMGFYGEGLVREITGHQDELRRITRAIRLGLRSGVPRTWVPRGSQVSPSDIDDRIGTICEYTGNQAPVTTAPNAVSAQWLDWRREIRSDGINQGQVSELAAYSNKPAGLNSAVAQQTYMDIEDTRFLDPAENREALFVGAALQVVRIRKAIAKRNGGKVVAWQSKRNTWMEVSWDEVDLEGVAYTMQVYPVASLPSEPAGQSDLVELWLQRGIIDQDTYRELLKLPDTDGYSDMMSAPKDFVMQQLEEMIMEPYAVQAHPDPTIGYEVAFRMGRLVYAAARRDGCPEDRLRKVRQYLVEAEAELRKMAQPSAPAPTDVVPPPIPGAPQVEPMPLPGAGPQMPMAGGMQ